MLDQREMVRQRLAIVVIGDAVQAALGLNEAMIHSRNEFVDLMNEHIGDLKNQPEHGLTSDNQQQDSDAGKLIK